MLRASLFSRGMLSRQPQQTGSVCQVSEFLKPTDIITHCPTLAERFPFHLDAFLYQKPPEPLEAVKCHERFRECLHDICGARVWTVREVLSQLRIADLRRMVIETSNVRFTINPTKSDHEIRDAKHISIKYLDYSLSGLSKNHLIDLLMLHPEITINVDNTSTGFSVTEIPISPLSNMMFTRDPQLTTAYGVVMGRCGATQRSFETVLMKAVWKQLGVPLIASCEDQEEITLEGGDFFPFGEDMCMLGVGVRTNLRGARFLTMNNLIGTKKFVLVENPRDKTQERTHLDTVFNVLDEHTCLCWDLVARDDPKVLRIAREFELIDGKYVEQLQMPFGKWLKRQGFHVIQATHQQSEDYFLNVLHLGKDSHGRSQVLATSKEVAEVCKREDFNGDVHWTDLSPITSMYGGVRCCTQVLREVPKTDVSAKP